MRKCRDLVKRPSTQSTRVMKDECFIKVSILPPKVDVRAKCAKKNVMVKTHINPLQMNDFNDFRQQSKFPGSMQ